MTFRRYDALKQSWREMPPLAVTTFAIAKILGLDMKAAPDMARQYPAGDVFYDESYYDNTTATPWDSSAYEKLSADFETAGGGRESK